MCIRDRFEISDGRSVDEVFNALLDNGLQPVMSDYIYAVSYTHLDVYKRQMYLHRLVHRVGCRTCHVSYNGNLLLCNRIYQR